MIDGVRGLNKKSEGPGIMGSGTQDELRGFGFRCSARELERVNAWRLVKYDGKKPPLVMSPGLRFLKYGKNNAGYWNAEQFAEQCQARAPFLFSVLDGRALLPAQPSPRRRCHEPLARLRTCSTPSSACTPTGSSSSRSTGP